jgi:hypothetical protein
VKAPNLICSTHEPICSIGTVSGGRRRLPNDPRCVCGRRRLGRFLQRFTPDDTEGGSKQHGDGDG